MQRRDSGWQFDIVVWCGSLVCGIDPLFWIEALGFVGEAKPEKEPSLKQTLGPK